MHQQLLEKHLAYHISLLAQAPTSHLVAFTHLSSLHAAPMFRDMRETEEQLADAYRKVVPVWWKYAFKEKARLKMDIEDLLQSRRMEPRQ